MSEQSSWLGRLRSGVEKHLLVWAVVTLVGLILGAQQFYELFYDDKLYPALWAKAQSVMNPPPFSLWAVFISVLFVALLAFGVWVMSIVFRQAGKARRLEPENAALVEQVALKEREIADLRKERTSRMAMDGLYSISDATAEIERIDADLERVTKERDEAQTALKNVTWNFAMERLNGMVERAAFSGYEPSVVIRFGTYDDFALVQTIESVFKDHTKWTPTLEPPPQLLRPHDGFKVLFDLNDLGPFRQIPLLFGEGGLLPADAHVGVRWNADANARYRILIEVLPTAKVGS